MSATNHPLHPRGSASVSALATGYRTALRSHRVCVYYDRSTADDAAELAVLLRDEGDWELRFGTDADEVRSIIAGIDKEGRL